MCMEITNNLSLKERLKDYYFWCLKGDMIKEHEIIRMKWESSFYRKWPFNTLKVNVSKAINITFTQFVITLWKLLTQYVFDTWNSENLDMFGWTDKELHDNSAGNKSHFRFPFFSMILGFWFSDPELSTYRSFEIFIYYVIGLKKMFWLQCLQWH